MLHTHFFWKCACLHPLGCLYRLCLVQACDGGAWRWKSRSLYRESRTTELKRVNGGPWPGGEERGGRGDRRGE